MYRIDLGKLNQKSKPTSKQLTKALFMFVALSSLALVATNAYAGYQCKLAQNCKMTWTPAGTGILDCPNPSWDCMWFPEAPSSSPPPPPPPQPPTPPPPLPPIMSPAEKIVFCNTVSFEIAADLRSCKAEAELKRDMQFSNCGVRGTVVWNFGYAGNRMSVYHTNTSDYGYNEQCNNITASFAGYSTAMCQAEENRARGRAVGICGPIQW